MKNLDGYHKVKQQGHEKIYNVNLIYNLSYNQDQHEKTQNELIDQYKKEIKELYK